MLASASSTTKPRKRGGLVWRILGAVIGVIVIWVALFAAALFNWGNITARELATKYEVTGYPQGSTVLMGSSTIQGWTDSERALGPLETVNVGIGGSVIESWPGLIDSLVTPFAPEAVVIYVGANDLHNQRQSASEAFSELEALIGDVRAAVPDAQVYFVSVYTTDTHSDLMSVDDEFNRLASELDDVTFIDVATALRSEAGEVRPELFAADGVHLNEDGYEILGIEMRAALGADQTEVFLP